MSQEVWFPETEVVFDVSCNDLDIFDDLSGNPDGLFDLVAYVWRREHLDFLQQIAGAVPLDDLTPIGTVTVWTCYAGTLRERMAAVIVHQLHYVEKVSVCYDWDPELWASCRRGKSDGAAK